MIQLCRIAESRNRAAIRARNYNGLLGGAWRSGTDAYYLWANVSQGDFLAKWSQLQGQNLRLIDLEVTAVAGAGGSTGGVTGTARAPPPRLVCGVVAWPPVLNWPFMMAVLPGVCALGLMTAPGEQF